MSKFLLKHFATIRAQAQEAVKKSIASHPERTKVVYLLPYDSDELLFTVKESIEKLNFPWNEELVFHPQLKEYSRAPFIFLKKGEYLTMEEAYKHPSCEEDLLKLMQEHPDVLIVNIFPQWASSVISRPSIAPETNFLIKAWKRCRNFWRWRNFSYINFYEATPLSNYVDFILAHDYNYNNEGIVKVVEGLQSQIPDGLTKADVEVQKKLASAIADFSINNFHQLLERRLSSKPILSRKELMKAVLETKNVQNAIVSESKKSEKAILENPKELKEANAKAEEIIKEISSDLRWSMLKLYDRCLRLLWKRFYSKINIKGLDALTETLNSQDNTNLVYVSTHRSHLDYLLLSYILSEYSGIKTPNIAAGVNLDFFPVGSFFRRGGAFFLRRTFKNNLYKEIFTTYIAQLIKENRDIEFFIEGGRSRTGRLLAPKTGMLNMTIDGFLENPNANQYYVPVFLAYDKVFESSTYIEELQGKKKNKESFFLVLKNLKKVKYQGNVHVNFAKPINLPEFFSEIYPEWAVDLSNNNLDKAKVAEVSKALSRVNMQAINANATVSSQALLSAVLFKTDGKNERKQLLADLAFIQEVLLKTKSFNNRYTIVKDQPKAILKDLTRIYKKYVEVDDDNNLNFKAKALPEFNYYRNNIEHCFIAPSLAAIMLLNKLDNSALDCFSKYFTNVFNCNSFTSFTVESLTEQVLYFKEELASASTQQLELLAKQLSNYLTQIEVFLSLAKKKIDSLESDSFQLSSVTNDVIDQLKEEKSIYPDYSDKTSLNQLRIALLDSASLDFTCQGLEKAITCLKDWK